MKNLIYCTNNDEVLQNKYRKTNKEYPTKKKEF